MLALIGTTAAAVIAFFVFRKSPRVLPALAIAIYILLPFAAIRELFPVLPAGPSIHPAFIFTLICMALLSLMKPPASALSSTPKALANLRPFVVLLGISFLTWSASVTYFNQGAGSFGIIISQIAGPFLLLVLIGMASRHDPQTARFLTQCLCILSILESALAWSVEIGLTPRFYDAAFASDIRYAYVADRAQGTMDSPLLLAMLLAASIPFSGIFQNQWTRACVGMFLFSGVLLTESRYGLILAILAIFVSLLRRGTGAPTGASRAPLIGAALLAMVAVLFTPYANRTFNRFREDVSSTATRQVGLRVFEENWTSNIFGGGGSGHSYQLGNLAGVGGSIESSPLMYALDYGLIATLIFFAFIAAVAIVAISTNLFVGWPLLIFILGSLSYSSIAVYSAAGPILWVFVALVVFEQDPPSEGEQTAGSAPTSTQGTSGYECRPR